MLEVRRGARGNGLNTSPKPTLPPGSPAESSAARRGKQHKWPLVDARSPSGPSGVARVASGEGKLAGTALDTRTYDNGGRLSTSAYSNGITTTWSYRNDNLVTSINATSPAGTPNDSKVANLAYTWDANKNKLSEVHSGVNATVNGFGFNAADTAYDFEDRLTQWKRANGTENQSWNLTSVGDWQSFTRNGTSTARTHGPTHELLAIGSASLSYDAKGNLTQDTSRSPTQNYIWDFDNKMKSADIDGNGSPDVTFEFDALGRRVARTQGSDAVIYYQVDQQTIADYPRGGAATSPTYRYFWASYIDELIARKATGSGGELLFGHRNQQYSILSLSDSSGAVVERVAYQAYGQQTFTNASGTTLSTSAKATRYSYTGREWDASLQLRHFRARWMSGLSGRFLGRDPVEFESNATSLFEYLKGNPLSEMDWEGHSDSVTTAIRKCAEKPTIAEQIYCLELFTKTGMDKKGEVNLIINRQKYGKPKISTKIPTKNNPRFPTPKSPRPNPQPRIPVDPIPPSKPPRDDRGPNRYPACCCYDYFDDCKRITKTMEVDVWCDAGELIFTCCSRIGLQWAPRQCRQVSRKHIQDGLGIQIGHASEGACLMKTKMDLPLIRKFALEC